MVSDILNVGKRKELSVPECTPACPVVSFVGVDTIMVADMLLFEIHGPYARRATFVARTSATVHKIYLGQTEMRPILAMVVTNS